MRPPPDAVSAPSRQGAEGWFPWVVGFAGALLATAWAGAALAAAVTTGARVRVIDAGPALTKLPMHAADPAEAWPGPSRTALPGPVVYWACQLAVLTALALVGTAAYVVWRRAFKDRPGPLGVRNEGGLAGRRDLRRLTIRRAHHDRLTLGRCNGRLLAGEPQASLAVIGPTGCGKTAGFAIPALLEWRGPIIATSVKTDLVAATIEHRRRCGSVWVYDPTEISGQLASNWSPLDACDTWQGATRTAAWMVEAAQPRRDSVTDGDYWYGQARKALAPYLHAGNIRGAGLADLVRWIDTQERAEVEQALLLAVERADRGRPIPDGGGDVADAKWRALWDATVSMTRAYLAGLPEDDERRALVDRPTEEWPIDFITRIDDVVEAEWMREAEAALRQRGGEQLVDAAAPLNAARSLWAKESRLQGSVFATIENVLVAWADPGVGWAAAGGSDTNVDVKAWLKGDNTIYVVASPFEQGRLRPVLTVLMQQALRAAYDEANQNGGRLDVPCLVMLDEAGNITPLPDLPGYVSTARSHRITIVTVWQDVAQITGIYRDRAQTVLNNHRAKLFGTGIADGNTLEYVSRLVGDETRTERSVATDVHGGRRSISEHKTYRRAAPADAIRRLPENEALLLYESLLPAHVHLRPWFEERSLRAIADRPDLIQNERRTRARLRR
ncbi:MAG: type secretion system protein VirD4 [Actinomycetota bacterium]|jgi:type IV secretion system protein VirD4